MAKRFSDGYAVYEVRDEFNPQQLKDMRAEVASQVEFAKQAGISRGTLANYETGRRTPSRNQAARLALALDVSLDELYTWLVEEATPAAPQRHSRDDTAAVAQPA